MKKVLFFSLILFLSSIPLFCQEVVVFADDRSMTVKSHREKEGFVYLQLPEGEIAVPKQQIKEIRNEKVSSASISDKSSTFLKEEITDQPVNFDRGRRINPIKNFSARSQPQQEVKDDDEDADDGEDSEDIEDDSDEEINPTPKNDSSKPSFPRLSPAMQLPQKPQRDNTTGPVLRKR